MTKKKQILFSVALILPMLIMFYFMDFYAYSWEIIKSMAADLAPRREDIVPMLKAFGIVLVSCAGFCGMIILWDALSKDKETTLPVKQ